MIFETRINGIPCQCKVLDYCPGRPMKVTGPGFGDADPPEPPEFDFEILDRRGNKAPWLSKHITPQIELDLLEE